MNFPERGHIVKEDILTYGCFVFMGGVFVLWLAFVIMILYRFLSKYWK
jgi:hypothetical protein